MTLMLYNIKVIRRKLLIGHYSLKMVSYSKKCPLRSRARKVEPSKESQKKLESYKEEIECDLGYIN